MERYFIWMGDGKKMLDQSLPNSTQVTPVLIHQTGAICATSSFAVAPKGDWTLAIAHHFAYGLYHCGAPKR